MPGFSGVGLVTLFNRTAGGLQGLGTFVGNCPKLTIAQDPKSVERNESMTTARAPLRRMTQTTAASITLVTDEFNKKNFARAVRGRIDEVAADTSTVHSKTHPTGAAVGDVLGLDLTNVNTITVKDSTGTPLVLTKDVNYTEDAFSGQITLIDITTGGPFVQPFVTTCKQGAVSVIAGLALPDTELWLALAGVNADTGEKGTLDVFRVRFDPAKTLDFINNDYQDYELTGTALQDSTKTAAGVGGQIFKFSLPSTIA